jgi:hypothetical protein
MSRFYERDSKLFNSTLSYDKETAISMKFSKLLAIEKYYRRTLRIANDTKVRLVHINKMKRFYLKTH